MIEIVSPLKRKDPLHNLPLFPYKVSKRVWHKTNGFIANVIIIRYQITTQSIIWLVDEEGIQQYFFRRDKNVAAFDLANRMICLVLLNSLLFPLPCGAGSAIPREGFDLSVFILAALLVCPMLGCRHSLLRLSNISQLYLRSPKGGCCAISDDLSCPFFI